MDIERVTGLPIDQLLDITACVAPLLDHDEVAAWTSLNLFESVIVTTLYLRQNQIEDFIAAIFGRLTSDRLAATDGPRGADRGRTGRPEARSDRGHPTGHGPRRRNADPDQ